MEREFLHQELTIGPEDAIEVTFDRPANVQLLDPENYNRYLNKQAFNYWGGFVTQSPYRIRPPHPGKWHLVIDLGGAPGSVQASGSIISGTIIGR